MTIADMLIKKMVKYNIIKEDEEEIYQFGLEGLSLKILHYLTYLLIAIFFNDITNFIIFFCAFLILRKNAGGYHAKTKGQCYLISCITIVSVMVIMRITQEADLLLEIGSLLLVIADVFILILAPMGNRNRELDLLEMQTFRKRTMVILAIENILVCVVTMYQKVNYPLPLVLAILCESIILVIEKIRRK